jgi:hypothetical protein
MTMKCGNEMNYKVVHTPQIDRASIDEYFNFPSVLTICVNHFQALQLDLAVSL